MKQTQNEHAEVGKKNADGDARLSFMFSTFPLSTRMREFLIRCYAARQSNENRNTAISVFSKFHSRRTRAPQTNSYNRLTGHFAQCKI